MKKRLMLVVAVSVVTACQRKTEEKKIENAAPPAAAATAPAVVLPAGLEHVKNDAWQDGMTPTDELKVDGAAAEKAYATRASESAAAYKQACAAHPGRVLRLNPEKSRVGYVSYKNFELPVKGYIPGFEGYVVVGEVSEVRVWGSVLKLDSGDAVRDSKLKKLFFEVESVTNPTVEFVSTSVTPDAGAGLPDVEGQSARGTVAGNLALHGKSNTVSLPLVVTKTGDHWEATTTAEVLLPFEPFGFLEPLKALMKSCNHKAIASSALVELNLVLETGCKN